MSAERNHPNDAFPCNPSPWCSAACSRGTKGCNAVHHDPPSAEAKVRCDCDASDSQYGPHRDWCALVGREPRPGEATPEERLAKALGSPDDYANRMSGNRPETTRDRDRAMFAAAWAAMDVASYENAERIVCDMLQRVREEQRRPTAQAETNDERKEMNMKATENDRVIALIDEARDRANAPGSNVPKDARQWVNAALQGIRADVIRGSRG